MIAANGAPTRIAVMIGQLSQGGSESQMHAFLARCDRDRWSPIVYVSGELGPWSEVINELGIPIVLLHGSPAMKMWRFRQSCKRNNVQSFFSWSGYTNGYGLALLGLGIPRMGSFRSKYPTESSYRHGWLRAWTGISGVSTIVCNSPETADAVRRQVGDRKHVIYVPNSVQPVENIDRWRALWRRRLEISDGEVLILGVGRLTPQKNYSRFIRSVELVHQRQPVRAVVAGKDDGSLAGLQRQVKASTLEPGVITFIGAVPNAQELVCAADIFVHTSNYEGLPNAVMEAMSTGIPCVCTEVNGISTLIENGVNGFITNHSAGDVADRVLGLARDKMLREVIGGRASESMKGRFDPHMIAAQLWQLCERAEA